MRNCSNSLSEASSVKPEFAVVAPSPECVPAGVERPALPNSRLIYGDARGSELAIEWHEPAPAATAHNRRTPPGVLELCVNLTGQGLIRCGGRKLSLEPCTAAFYSSGPRGVQSSRVPNDPHRFVTFAFSKSFLRSHLAACDGALHPLVEKLLANDSSPARLGVVHRLTTDQTQRALRLLHPPVPQAARGLWYRSQALEFAAEFLFERSSDDELFCDRQKRMARERVDRVIAILRKRIADPPGLAEIGRQARCSPFHLSRTFSREMGMTIPQYIRKLRMERAAELLRSGRCNVTEAALEVGYSSLSHFSQAFCQVMGCCPCLYPLKRSTTA